MQLIESRRVSRARKWWIRGTVLTFAAIGVAIWLGYRPAVERYKRWKQDRALGQAREFIAKRDPASAKLALEVALNTAPGNLETIRVAAGMLEQAGSAQAMRLRRMVALANPNSVEDAAALVYCCLRFNDLNAAKDALAAFRPTFAEEPAALRAALAYAIATDNSPAIDFTYAKLRARFPDDDDLKASHALLHLRHPKAETRNTARRQLEELARTNATVAPRIQRELGTYSLLTRDEVGARKWFGLVAASPAATFADHLQIANLDLLIDKKPFDTVFPPLAARAEKNEADATRLAQWLGVQNRAEEAKRWIATLPAQIRASAALKQIEATLAAQTKDWDRFIVLLRDDAWGPISKETLRLVEAAQAISAQDRPALRRETWDLALQSAGGHLGTLTVLQRVAATWQWDAEIERTLWAIVRGFPDQTWAHQTLFDYYSRAKNTGGMRDVMSALQQSDASVRRYRYDWALLTLLTNPSSGPTAAKDTMGELYRDEPTNPAFATGHAFALALSRKGAEALAIVQKLPDDERVYPPRQPYLAYVYAVARDQTGVQRAEEIGKNVTLLPEETRLFERAREELARKPESPAKVSKKPAKSD
jgi:hypothetical protein